MFKLKFWRFGVLKTQNFKTIEEVKKFVHWDLLEECTGYPDSVWKDTYHFFGHVDSPSEQWREWVESE